MKTVKAYLLPTLGFAIMVVALLLASPSAMNAAPPTQDVRVVNSTLEPVPTVAQGTTTIAGNVSVTNTPTVNLAPGAGVTVANTAANPVRVVNINDAAQPFQAGTTNVQSGTNVSTATVATVPAGKRLVIEFVSMNGQVPPGQHVEILEITTVGGSSGMTHQFLIEAQPQAVIGDSIFRAVQSLRLYANAGTQVTALFRRNSNAGSATFGVTLSGYLVDIP